MARGIAKNPKMKSEKLSKAHKGKHHSISSEFRKGMTPWNKDKKGLQVAWNKGKSNTYRHTEETKMKIRNANKGDRHYNWQGGITAENDRIRNSLELRLWRKAVFERDGYCCRECGAKNGQGETVKLHAHHIKPFAWFPELRFAIDNGITLCAVCHSKTDTYAGKIRSYVPAGQ